MCHVSFVAKPSDIRKGGGKFCSPQCFDKARQKRIPCFCLMCHRALRIIPSDKEQGFGKYCSKRCYRAHQHDVAVLTERFWSFVVKTDTCWLWQGNRGTNGYGRFSIGYDRIPAHRFAYELNFGLILPGLFCCHHCDNPLCVRPEHLFLGTHGDNMRDMYHKQRNMHHTRPETLARGIRSGAYTHPETIIRGEQKHNAKLTDDKVRAIRHLRDTEQWTYPRLAAYFGVSITLIKHVVMKKIWRHVA